MTSKLQNFTDVLGDPDEIGDSQPLSLSSVENFGQYHASSILATTTGSNIECDFRTHPNVKRPAKGTGQYGEFRSLDEIDVKYRNVFSYPFFNLVQSRVIEDALYSDKSMVICAPTGSGKTVVFEMAIVRLLMELEDRNENHDFKIIYMAPVKALCTERLTEWYSKFTKLGLLCIEVTGDTDVDFSQLKPYRIIITTPEKWDMLTRRWRDHRQLVEVIKLFLIDEVHILNDESRGPVLEAVVSRMKTIETSVQSTHRIEQLQQQYLGTAMTRNVAPSIRFVAVSATVSNPEDVATWLGTSDKPAVYYKFGDECRPVKLRRVVEGYHCAEGTSIFKFDLVLNYKLWPIIQKYHDGKPTLIFCNTRKSVAMTAETLSREITISFNEEQRARLTALASTIKNKKLQTLVMSGVGCHHAGLLYEERNNIEQAFRNRDLPILITTTTLAMGVNLPAHLVIIKNTQQYVSGAYQEYSISTVLQMVGRAGRPQFDTEATAVIMTRMSDKPRYQALVGGSEPLQSYLHKRLPENLNSEAALGTVNDVAQCVQWLRSTFLSVRAAQDPKRYLGLPPTAPHHHIAKKIEELCVKAMNGLASSGLITMDEACCIESTEAGRLMSIFYLDLETMKHIMKIEGSESLERLLWIVCESHELSDMHLRMDERRCLNALNRNNSASIIRFPMKGKITTRQMKLNCVIQAILGCLIIPDPSLNQEATKIMRIADRVCKCLVAYVTRPALVCQQPQYYTAVLNSITLAKCVAANLWENSPFVCKQLKGIGPTFSTLLATAGKVNFMLLEESHPRDLERIMNKGPPAGNILRKQISLFPKYLLTITPVDENVVSIQLVLLNHHNLSENMEHLTAGTAHKSYIIIGDSENILLLLTSFSDKDLIGVYDGSITYQITRKHGFEHKIYAHCVSSTFAGIDAQCEYIFQDLNPKMYPNQLENSDDLIKKPVKKQTTITDTFRERKRKNTDSEIAKSKEKKKRESALFEKFKNLKESFGKTSKVLKDDLDKSTVMSQKILQELTHLEKDVPSAFHSINVTEHNKNEPVKSTFFEEPTTYEINDADFMSDAFMDEDKINDILNEIECEITKSSKSEFGDKTKSNSVNNNDFAMQNTTMSRPVINTKILSNSAQIKNNKAMNNSKKRVHKNVIKKSNYNFIDLLEKNIDLSDTEETTVQEQNSFSDTIRSHIEKYLKKAETNVKPPNRVLDLTRDEPAPSKEIGPIVIVHDSKIIGREDDNMSEHGETMRLSSNLVYNEKDVIPDEEKELTAYDKSKQVTLLEHKIKSLDLTVDAEQLQSTDRRNIQEIDEENELQAVKLHQNISKHYNNIAIDNVEGTMESRIIPEYTYANNSSNINIETVCQPFKTMKPTNTKNVHVDKLNELYIKKQDSVLYEDERNKDHCQNYSGIDKDKTRVAIPSPYPLLKEKSKLAGIEQPNGIDNLLKEAENEKVMAYNDPLPNHNLNYKKPLDLASTSYIAQTNEKQELHMLELWKNYMKELPPLSFKQNNKEITAYNNPMTCNDIANQKTSTEQVDNYQEQPGSQCSDVKEKQKNTEKPKNKGLGFIPPYKHPNDGDNIKTVQSAFILEIDPAINVCTENRRKVSSDATGAFRRQQISTPQIHKLPLTLPNTASVPKLQNKLSTIEQTNSNTTAIQNCPAYTQLHYDNDKPKFHLPSTNTFTSEFQEQGPLDIQSITTINKDVATFNNPTICGIENRQNFSEQNYDPARTNNKEHYINKYSFTSSKTDVLTQETADQVVRVIRNLRIDLDITEIVSKDKKSKACYSGTDIDGQINRNEEYLNMRLKTDASENNQSIEQCIGNTSAIQSANYSSGFGNSTLLEKYNAKTLANSDYLPVVPKSWESPTLQPLPATKHNQVIRNVNVILNTDTSSNNQSVEQCNGNTSAIQSANYSSGFGNSTKLLEKYNGKPLANSCYLPVVTKSSESETLQPLPANKHNQVIRSGIEHGEVIQVDKDNEEETNTFSRYKIEDFSKEMKPNNVMGILQKYSNIMRNNTRNLADTQTQIKVTEKTSSVAKKDKSKRPFKISDIHRLNPAPLPSVLKENTQLVNISEGFKLLEPKDKHVQLERNKHLNIISDFSWPKEPLIEHEYNEDLEVAENESTNANLEDISYCDPYTEDLEVKDSVSNIDQTMFNPKTLLQCFSTDEPEDIVPPPPEFSDFLNTTDADVTLPADSYEPMVWEEEMNEHRQGIYSRSIFQDDSKVELTPSKEIETWNLSQDEGSCEKYAAPGLSPYSFTIVRKNKEQTYQMPLASSLLQNKTHSRHKRLQQFKFNHKNKFKM